MLNREELRQIGSKEMKNDVSRERGENIIFRRGVGINTVFGLIYIYIHP
jgi:hypothetical protein